MNILKSVIFFLGIAACETQSHKDIPLPILQESLEIKEFLISEGFTLTSDVYKTSNVQDWTPSPTALGVYRSDLDAIFINPEKFSCTRQLCAVIVHEFVHNHLYLTTNNADPKHENILFKKTYEYCNKLEGGEKYRDDKCSSAIAL